MNKATWQKGDQKITGRWVYRGSDTFYIELNKKDEITGRLIQFTIKADHPEWNGWKRVYE